MQKKLLGIILAGAMALSLSACSSDPAESGSTNKTTQPTTSNTTEPTTAPTELPAEPDTVGSFAEQYKEDREQGPDWFYMYDNGEGWKELVTAESVGHADYGDNWRLEGGDEAGNYTSFTDWEGVKADISGNEGKTKLAAVYQASADGTVTIAPWTHAMYGVNEDYEFVAVADTAPDVTVSILHNDEELYTYTGKDASKASEELKVEVKAGDKIYFTASSGGNAAETLISYKTLDVQFAAA